MDAPADSFLKLGVRSSNSPVTVSAHAAFEGTFTLYTSNKRPEVRVGDTVEDPAGKSRERAVRTEHMQKNLIHGSVAWEGEAAGKGLIDIRSSNALVRLDL